MIAYGGIEAGGTKFVCGIGDEQGELVAEVRFPTTHPEESIRRALDFFREGPPIAALGIASFGPLDLRASSPAWGHITSTPKPGWSGTDLAGPFREALGVPIAFDTDVNGAALGEQRWGAAQGLDTFLYLTIGTGIGGGGMAGGRLLHGLVHPEMGHILIPHDRERDPFPGACPFHGDCWEGLAAGPAIEARWSARGETLPDDHPAWALEAHYIALGLANLALAHSPQRIILGGGVMARKGMFAKVRREFIERLGGYVRAPEILDSVETFIVPPGLGDRAGVLGAIALAMNAT